MGSSNIRVAGFPSGSTQLPYPLLSTPANYPWARNNARTATTQICGASRPAENPNRLAMPPECSESRSFHPVATNHQPLSFSIQRPRDPVSSGSSAAIRDLFRSGRRDRGARHPTSGRRLPAQEQAANNRPTRPKAKCVVGRLLRLGGMGRIGNSHILVDPSVAPAGRLALGWSFPRLSTLG